MILVQNPQRLLSGNRWFRYVFLLAIIFNLGACSLIKRIGTEPSLEGEKDKDVQIFDDENKLDKGEGEKVKEDNSQIDSVSIKEDSLSVEIDTVTTSQKDTLEKEKKIYQIGLIAPFNLHDFNPCDLDYTLSEDSKMALDLYTGILEGIQSEKNQKNIDIHLQVYDTENNDTILKGILDSSDILNSDIIIGPISKKSAKKVSDFSKAHKIYQVLPFSPSESIGKTNPYHIKINPSIQVHLDKIAADICSKQSLDKKYFVFYLNNNREYTYLRLLQESVCSRDSNLCKRFVLNPIEDLTDIRSLLETTEEFSLSGENIIFIPSHNDGLIHNILRHLYKKHQEGHVFTVYGMPSWIDKDLLRLEYLIKLNTHVSTSYWIDETDTRTLAFEKAYRRKYHHYPSKYAFIGYDIAKYIWSTISKNTLWNDVKNDSNNPKHYKGLHTSFLFEQDTLKTPLLDSIKRVGRIENKYLHMLKYDGYAIKKID